MNGLRTMLGVAAVILLFTVVAPRVLASGGQTVTVTVDGGQTPAPGATPTPGPQDTSFTMQASDPNPAPGEQILISGGGFAPGVDLTITFESAPVFIGTATAEAHGEFSALVRVPADATPGLHHFIVTGANTAGGENRDVFPVMVRGAASGGGGSGGTTSVLGSTISRGGGLLPRTGADVLRLVAFAFALVSSGTSLVLAARWRRRNQGSSAA